MKRYFSLLFALLLLSALACGESNNPPATNLGSQQDSQIIPGLSDQIELGNITSLRMMMFWRAEYADGGTEELILEEGFNRSPLAYHSRTEVNNRGQLGLLEVIQIDNQKWSGLEGNWTHLENEPFSFVNTQIPIYLLDYSELLTQQYQQMDPDTVNNIPTRHYRLTTPVAAETSPWWIGMVQSSYGLGANLTGFVTELEELWIADQAGLPAFAVRLVREAVAKDSEGNEVQISESRFVAEVNGSVVIQAPSAMPVDWPPPDVPIYPGGVVETMTPEAGGGLLIIHTDASPDTVASFYEQNLPQFGWQQTEVSKTAEKVTASWQKAGRILGMEIDARPEGASVTITVAPP